MIVLGHETGWTISYDEQPQPSRRHSAIEPLLPPKHESISSRTPFATSKPSHRSCPWAHCSLASKRATKSRGLRGHRHACQLQQYELDITRETIQQLLGFSHGRSKIQQPTSRALLPSAKSNKFGGAAQSQQRRPTLLINPWRHPHLQLSQRCQPNLQP